jgi:hypothetical protein
MHGSEGGELSNEISPTPISFIDTFDILEHPQKVVSLFYSVDFTLNTNLRKIIFFKILLDKNYFMS